MDEVDLLFEAMSTEECLDRLGTVSVGRVALSVDALPVVLPVNYCLFDGAIVFRTAPGTKLEAATSGAVVAFEIDGYERDGRSGWSVLLRGVASEVTDPDDLSAIKKLQIEAWALDGFATRVVRIEPTLISGRRFVRDTHDTVARAWVAILDAGYL